MTRLAVHSPGPWAPALVEAMGERARWRFLAFFTANIRNPNTRRAYLKDVTTFLAWCEERGVRQLGEISSFHVASYIEQLTQTRSAPTAKRHLAALRNLFDWLVIGQVVPANPATSVRGPKHSQREGVTPVLEPEEARAILDAIDTSTLIGLRDRALIALMVYSFARVSAATGMQVEDVYVQNRRLWVRLHEKGGKLHKMPCHHSLEEHLDAWLDGSGLRHQPKAPLFPTIRRGTARSKSPQLGDAAMGQSDAYAMVQRRALAAGIATHIGNHTFRGTGITTYLKNGGTLEKARDMANHSDPRTTQLYDRRRAQVSLDEVEKIQL